MNARRDLGTMWLLGPLIRKGQRDFACFPPAQRFWMVVFGISFPLFLTGGILATVGFVGLLFAPLNPGYWLTLLGALVLFGLSWASFAIADPVEES